jgi:hypothetical protein
MFKIILTPLSFALILLTLSTSANAVILTVVDGQLMGAKEVDVYGVLYDVELRDGTCIELFDGCDDNSDFIFYGDSASNSVTGVNLALNALRGQVFIDGPQGAFLSDETLTNGCEPDRRQACYIRTPWRLAQIDQYDTGFLQNKPGTYLNLANSNGDEANQDTGEGFNASIITFAVWSPTVVSAPATLSLFCSGLAGLGMVRRKRPTRS